MAILKHIFLTLFLCFLARVEAHSSRRQYSIQSDYRKHNPSCGAGNLIKIYTDPICKANGRCKAKFNGESIDDPKTRFTFVRVGKKKCIQFTDGRDHCSKYALKVVNGTKDITFEKRECDSNIGNDYLFVEEKVKGSRIFIYKHIDTNTCLGVTDNCADHNLRLIDMKYKSSLCSVIRHRRFW